MADLLTPVQTTRKVRSNVEKFEALALIDRSPQPVELIEISPDGQNRASKISRHKKQDSLPFLQQTYLQDGHSSVSLPDDAREILKSQPDFEDFLAVLRYLQFGIEGKHDFNIRASGPKASQVLNVLVTVAIPDRWASLNTEPVTRQDTESKHMLLSCLTCVAGLGALHAQIKRLTGLATSTKTAEALMLRDCIDVLAEVLRPSSFIDTVLGDTMKLHIKLPQRAILWQELSSFVAGGKILSAVAQAFPLAELGKADERTIGWLGDGNQYSKWLANNICHAATRLAVVQGEAWPMLTQLLKRGLSLGHSDTFVTEIYTDLLLGTKALWTTLHLLVQGLARLDQRSFFYTLLRSVSTRFLHANRTVELEVPDSADNKIRAISALIAGIVKDNSYLEECLVEWLTTTNSDAYMLPLGTRRAGIAVLATNESRLQLILDKTLHIFSDKLQIQHTSILQQEATAQVILLAVGYLHRMKSEKIKKLSRSPEYLHAVSNRLGASLPRARYLGMIVGTAISRLVDTPSKAMNFDMEEMESGEAKAFLNLVNVDDDIGDIADLKNLTKMKTAASKALEAPNYKKSGASKNALPTHSSKIISIEEIADEGEDYDGLIPYEKPDDDPSDSDEDPTLINRAKPRAPVYITELIKGLQANDKLDTVELALKTAPALIRRKAGFGTELSENIDALVSTLINLQEGMSGEDAQQLRLRSLIACLVAQPAKMGLCFASMYFEGDFSLAQRASLLTTIGLGSRELAGYSDDADLATDKSKASFPSQRLPRNLETIYAPVNTLAKQLEHTTLQPMALAAADKLTGPDILKIRTFSSRLSVEKKTAQKAKERRARIPKDIHNLLAESIYLPLCCRMTLLLSSRPNANATTIFEPHILRLFLQTLTIIVTTLGPHALQLHTVTRETLLLLTNLHVLTQLSTDAVVLPALLQLLLTVLDLNVAAGTAAEEQLVTDFGSMVSELVAWAGNLANVVNVPETTGRDDDGGGMPWTVLVAGVQVKWHEVGRKFQGRMVGLVGSDLDSFGT